MTFEFPVTEQDDEIRRLRERMVEEWKKTHRMCAALIDQDRLIGNDPVGYKCDREATVIFWDNASAGIPFCGRCAEILETEPERVRAAPGSKIVLQGV